MTSCVLLVLRYSVHVDSRAVNLVSDWLIAIDIYTNFVFVSLTLAQFDKWYQKFFGCLDRAVKRLLRRGSDAEILAHYVARAANKETTANGNGEAKEADAGNGNGDGDEKEEKNEGIEIVVTTNEANAVAVEEPTAQRVQSISVTVPSTNPSVASVPSASVASTNPSMLSTPSVDE